MAYCSNCGHQLADGAKFCFECGTKVTTPVESQGEQRKTVYDGEIHKCPNCGDIFDAYESVCQCCGYERRGTKAPSSVRELFVRLQEIEERWPSLDPSSIFTQALQRGQISKTDEQKIELIKSYPIPNTKEDILEFAVMALSNVDPDAFASMQTTVTFDQASKQALSNAWLSKFDQAYQKGRLMFGDSPELLNLQSLYTEKKKLISKKKNAVWVVLGIVYGGIAAIAGIVLIIIALAGGFG